MSNLTTSRPPVVDIIACDEWNSALVWTLMSVILILVVIITAVVITRCVRGMTHKRNSRSSKTRRRDMDLQIRDICIVEGNSVNDTLEHDEIYHEIDEWYKSVISHNVDVNSS